MYNGSPEDDLTLRDGTLDTSYVPPPDGERGEPRIWMQDWRCLRRLHFTGDLNADIRDAPAPIPLGAIEKTWLFKPLPLS